jgi:hypothetical protein
MAVSKRRSSLLRACALAASVVAGGVVMVGAPASADPTNYTVTKIDGTVVDTGISTECHKNGTGPGSNVNAHWLNVPMSYAASPAELACAQAVGDFMLDLARHEDEFSSTAPQALRSSILSGTVNLGSPYEVFLDNIYVTTSALATLDTSAVGSGTGLGSCSFVDYMLIVRCSDDALGTIILRDDWGNPYRDWFGNPISFNLNGLLSQRGGTMYGNLFLTNDDAYGLQSFDDRTLHHEQVHSQQWSQWGWDFARRYIQDYVDSAGNANYNHWLYGPTQGVQVPAQCYQQFERAAGLQDGGYAFRDPLHGGPTSAAQAASWGTPYVPNGQAYPTGWTTSLNNAAGGRCPSTWQATTAL